MICLIWGQNKAKTVQNSFSIGSKTLKSLISTELDSMKLSYTELSILTKGRETPLVAKFVN